eukprot:CAMPEP_0180189226 /NCGR_PEP_ID=MMETSP0987-20121128/221_1 /TAXON_ID=697907 /ORGANISM="non described non described, Strain CCMP2293" /LENGTH=107 /DNA_ID=CAMNT_0022143547 /DNA_START=314 /DNA_END=637 /DNA_ORIENTATION=-
MRTWRVARGSAAPVRGSMAASMFWHVQNARNASRPSVKLGMAGAPQSRSSSFNPHPPNIPSSPPGAVRGCGGCPELRGDGILACTILALAVSAISPALLTSVRGPPH